MAIILSSKNWHWSQLVLVLFIFLTSIGVMLLAAGTLQIHQKLRKEIPSLESDLARFIDQNEKLLAGTDEQEGILELDHRLQIVARERGRVWRQVTPAGPLDNQNRLPVQIPHPQPHGLEKDSIVFAFESGDPNAQDPNSGPQYLGEFHVADANEGGAQLVPIQRLDRRSGERLTRSQGPWSLYETMPVDRHEVFASFSEEELRKILPPQSVEEYVRHGTPANADDDQWHRKGYNDDGEAVGPENLDQATKFLFDRPLRAYDYLFSELARELVVKLASIQAVTEDNALLEASLQSAEQLSKFRQQERKSLSNDLTGMKQDREAIEAHRDQVQKQLTNARQLIDSYRAANSVQASELKQRQLGLMKMIDRVAPAPDSPVLPGP